MMNQFNYENDETVQEQKQFKIKYSHHQSIPSHIDLTDVFAQG